MGHNARLNEFKKDYEKKHGTKLAVSRAEFLYYRSTEITTMAVAGGIGLILLGIDAWLIFFHERFAYCVLAWILIGLAGLFFLSAIPTGLSKIRDYQKRATEQKERRKLTRQMLADRFRNDKKDVKVYLLMFAFVCAMAAVAVRFYDIWVGGVAIFFGMLPCLFLIFAPVGLALNRKKNRRILDGDFVLMSSVLKDKYLRTSGDDTSVKFLTFGDRLPCGEYSGEALAQGDFHVQFSEYEEMQVGKEYYIVLIKSERARKKGLDTYDFCSYYPADEWYPDDELSLILRKG